MPNLIVPGLVKNFGWLFLSWHNHVDLRIIQDTHRDVLPAASKEIVDLIPGSLANIPNMAGLSMVDVGNTMGVKPTK
jgi:hypothetical protein